MSVYEDTSSDNNSNYCLIKELETLKSIYLDDLVEETLSEEDSNKTDNVEKMVKFSVNLFPSTADIINEQYVTLTLDFTIPPKYPEVVPSFEIKKARGLSEEKIYKLQKALTTMADEKKGSKMLYDLINYVKESLTSDNFPVGPCMVCLYEFTSDDIYVVTKCFHHFHSRCLANYVEKGKDQENKNNETKDNNLMPCPVCRDNSDLSHLVSKPANSYPPPTLSQKPLNEEQNLVEEAKQQQEKFASIFEKQQEKGGIIDVEAEKNRFLIKISNTESSNNNVEVSTNSSSSEYHSSDETKNEDDYEKTLSKNNSEELDKSSNKDAQGEKDNDFHLSKDLTQSKNDLISSDTKPQEEKTKSQDKEDKENNPATSRKPRSSRGRNRRKARSGQGQSSNTSKEEETSQNDARRSRSGRQRNNSNVNYSRSYKGHALKGNSGRGRNRYRYTGGGLASPPYRHNLGSFSYNEKNYQEDTSRDHDRPGYYAARIFRPANQKNFSKIEDSKTSPKTTGSDVTETRASSESGNRKGGRNANQNRRNKRYNNDGDYQKGNMQYVNTMQVGIKPRQSFQHNYRSQNTYGGRNYGYNGRNNYINFQNYNATYRSNYATGYATGYGYDVYYDYNYHRNNYGNNRVNYRPGFRNYQTSGYRQRKRNDTLQSHSSSKNENQTRKNEATNNDGPELNN